jgi:hypothetical protein
MSLQTSLRTVKRETEDYVTETTVTCDCCGKASYDNGEIKIGGCLHAGYMTVTRNISVADRILGTRSRWDFCSEKCMVQYFDIGGCC